MSLPGINYQTIKYNSEFQSYLHEKHRGLYIVLWSHNFNLDEIENPAHKRSILNLYKRFVEAKERFFPASSRPRESVISRKEIKEWLLNYRVVLGAKDGLFRTPPRELAARLVKRLIPIYENLAREMPFAMNILMHNSDLKFVIFPGSDIPKLSKNDTKSAVAKYVANNESMLITENSILSDDKHFFNNTIRHESYHALDYSITRTEIHGVTPTSRREIISFSDILNEKLESEKKLGRVEKTLDEITAEENKKTTTFYAEYEKLLEDAQTTYAENDPKRYLARLEEDKRRLMAAHKIWLPFFHALKGSGGRVVIHSAGGDNELDRQELLAYALQAYYNGDKEKLQKFNPDLYRIIVKYILPNFK